ncbi:MAG: 23S rRNA (adenine(2503)-C(2))-methyltransferase RlmN [Calditerrivibrio sp.]|nr:23S rRNA (adenine(2503)-C(2))-methyltransferase RlmN [Calditerrivibrio sp.]MCA1932989.1 23S rRNA (adenine(2503)-C(2))-methyltransferase RlmN [Calditerrivibrio sp.]MCA1980822.1 23S rRNA (adenine(2503)-C(2))-methyltransferase RlmN [Calditerrivibrio sp.]
MIKIDNMSLEEIKEFLKSLGEESYRGEQIYKWIFSRGVDNFEDMTDISKSLRGKLSDCSEFTKIEILEKIESRKDGSIKALFSFEDGEKIETVVLKDGNRNTLCISTQVGCRMGCSFCSTAKIGFKRDLTSAEILKQVIVMNRLLEEKGDKVTNIVYMGMGEPLDNIENVMRSLSILTDENGLGFSHRKVTVSTSGRVDNIDKIFSLKKPVNLAVSLNATTDSTRSEIMPVNRKFGIAELVGKLRELPLQKRKRITIEYVMLRGINDTIDDAKRIIHIVKGLPVKINLILYNPTIDSIYKPSTEESALKFQKYLTDRNFTVFIRKSYGSDIDGACGQLYAKYKKM